MRIIKKKGEEREREKWWDIRERKRGVAVGILCYSGIALVWDLYYACVRVLVTYMVMWVFGDVEGCDLCLVGIFMLWTMIVMVGYVMAIACTL